MLRESSPQIRLVPYDRTYLELSSTWLRDPEIKTLTMSPDFTREEQERFFKSLPGRRDYRIWGVEADGRPIGAAGIKHISGKTGESWLYIGERVHWGRGLGGRILEACEAEARTLGLEQLTMTALATNERSVRAYRKIGFEMVTLDVVAGTVVMAKTL